MNLTKAHGNTGAFAGYPGVRQTLAANGGSEGLTMAEVTCPRCGPINVPDELSTDMRRRIADIVRGGSGVPAMKLLHDERAASLKDGKALVMHLARRNGHCQRCGREIEVAEFASCKLCKALTITW
jgi:hypothetical protein